jgi:hypothetical protein
MQYCMVQPDRPDTPEHVHAFRVSGNDIGKRSIRGTRGDNYIISSATSSPAKSPSHTNNVFGSIDKNRGASTAGALDMNKPPMVAYVEQRAEEMHYRSVIRVRFHNILHTRHSRHRLLGCDLMLC